MTETTQNKYFTPNIEDIRVGYECERDTHSSLGWIKMMVADYHFKTKVPEGYTAIGLFNISEDLKQDNWIRVSYLTKEQIEAEGWKLITPASPRTDGRVGFEKGNHFFIFHENPETKMKGRVEFILRDVTLDDYTEWTSNGRVYLGECKDINTFRYICKLLNIS